MPKINYVNQIDVTVEKFLRACSPEELYEIDLLLDKPEYQDKLKPFRIQKT